MPSSDSKSFEEVIKNKKTSLYTITNQTGGKLTLTNYGARIVSWCFSDKNGEVKDVVLGFSTLKHYLLDTSYQGAVIGRYANRLANGEFSIADRIYKIAPNNGTHALHGGVDGFSSQVWDVVYQEEDRISFCYFSPDGEGGFPGNLKINVHYILTDEHELKISYEANTDKDTVINITNHAYFNLNGEGEGNILDHSVQLGADHYIPTDKGQIPLGEIREVQDTAFDFNSFHKITDVINTNDDQLKSAGGYDHCFVAKELPALEPIATIYADDTGIQLRVYTTEPGFQFYTGNTLTGDIKGKSDKFYTPFSGFCIETQHFPDAPNQPHFPSTLLCAGSTFHSQTTYHLTLINT